MTNNKIFTCIIGKSGTGKSSIANELEKRYNLKSVPSYTTREPRFAGENGHTFITLDDYERLKSDIAAYTYLYENHYFTTIEQIDNYDIYVVDYIGYESLKINYKGSKTIISIYIEIPQLDLMSRMFDRGDSYKDVLERLRSDNKIFKGVKNKCDYVIKNNKFEITVRKIYKIINKHT